MQLLFDFLPIALFFAVYQVAGIYVATAAAMTVAVAQIGWLLLRSRRVPRVQYLNAGILGLLGGLTLALHNDAFIMWKPSIINWAFALVFLLSLASRRSVTERMLGADFALPPHDWRRLTGAWAVFFIFAGALNAYVAFGYRVYPQDLGAAQRATYQAVATDAGAYTSQVLGEVYAGLPAQRQAQIAALPPAQRQADYLAKIHRDRWVNFKLFGLLGLTLLFALAQGVFIVRRVGQHAAGMPQGGAA